MLRSLHLLLGSCGGGSSLHRLTPQSFASLSRIAAFSAFSSRFQSGFRAFRMSSGFAGDGSDAYGGAAAPSATAVPPLMNKLKNRYCQDCGSPTKQVIPDGEEKMRAVCTICGWIHYENPKMVVGCLVEFENKVLLCRRKIQPSYGLWTLPAGYLEIGESAVEGAKRETLEEACAEVEVIAPFAQLDIPHIGQ